MPEEKKTVDIDTSGPEVDVQLPEEKKEEVVEQPKPKKTEPKKPNSSENKVNIKSVCFSGKNSK